MSLDLLLQDQLRQEVKSPGVLRDDFSLQRLERLSGRDQQRPGLLEEISHWESQLVEHSVARTVSPHHLRHPSGHEDQGFVYQVEDSVTEGDVRQEDVGPHSAPGVAGVAHQGLTLHPGPRLAGGDGRHHGEVQSVLQPVSSPVLGRHHGLPSPLSWPGEEEVAGHDVASHHLGLH